MSTFSLHLGDCRAVMAGLPENSVDSVVCDPPYGLGFMGKEWDHGVPGVEFWVATLRVLKPGGHLLAFGGSRTYHRLASAIEDAGFEIRDMLEWIYGQGFPKSRNVGGGWGTQLKPAHEPIVMARKPLAAKTIEANVAAHGTGGINIDGCRVGSGRRFDPPGSESSLQRVTRVEQGYRGALTSCTGGAGSEVEGRHPANLLHDGSDGVLELFPDSDGSGGSVPQVKITGYGDGAVGTGKSDYLGGPRTQVDCGTGSAARFFWCPKASKKDRGEGNGHPTVKPTELMAYLCRLVTPAGGTVLDPFMGSGSTGKAAVREGFRFIGIDTSREYVDTARKRIAAVSPYADLEALL